jgi:hypothetical protein
VLEAERPTLPFKRMNLRELMTHAPLELILLKMLRPFVMASFSYSNI